MSVFLTVLKVIGIILLVILALILLVLSLVLFVPFTYGVKGSYREKDPEGEARFSWLFRAHYPLAYHAVFGLVAATMLSILPTHFSGLPEALASLACAVLGAALAHWSAAQENRNKEAKAP